MDARSRPDDERQGHVRLVSWLDAGAWSGSHISHLGEPLCDTPVPAQPQARHERTAEIPDFPHICPTCLEVAIEAASAPIDELDAAPSLRVLA